MLVPSDYEEAYTITKPNREPIPCQAPKCFVNSYAPVAKPGQEGPFYVNTYLLQPNRQKEVAGAVSVRASDYKCN
jgi:hypothetical protein